MNEMFRSNMLTLVILSTILALAIATDPPAVGCDGEWREGRCSVSCGGGARVVTYVIKTFTSRTSAACKAANGTTISQACNSETCPKPAVDCVGHFETSGCSASCNGGLLIERYKVTTRKEGDGKACPFENGATQPTSTLCNTQACPPPPPPPEIGSESETPSSNESPSSVEETSAEVSGDCVGKFFESECSKTCGGGGFRIATYKIITPAAIGGKACEFVEGTTKLTDHECGERPCPVDCSGWFLEGPCSTTCGAGHKISTFVVDRHERYGGQPCVAENDATISTACEEDPCPVDCQGSWVGPGECSQTCAGGVAVSTFIITVDKVGDGKACEATNETTATTSCNTQSCDAPVPCKAHYERPPCPVSCGGGAIVAKYIIDAYPKNDGTACEYDDQQTLTETCGTALCPVNCEGEFVDAGCSTSCGIGEEIHKYLIRVPAANGGTPCLAPNETTLFTSYSCNLGECPVDCQGQWAVSQECSVSCEGGVAIYRFDVTREAAGKGKDCDADDGETVTALCNTQSCHPPVDCVGRWVEGSCSATCGGGVKISTFLISSPALNDGRCEAANETTVSAACGQALCPVDCVGGFVDGDCTKTCGGGRLVQTFKITTEAANNGKPCLYKAGFTRTAECNKDDCPPRRCGEIDLREGGCGKTCHCPTPQSCAKSSGVCTWTASGCQRALTSTACFDCTGSFVNTMGCSVTCGTGQVAQVYRITKPADVELGQRCPYTDGTTRTVPCITNPCPIDCVGTYVPVGRCSATCGNGQQLSRYTISRRAQYGGKDCPALQDATTSTACNAGACPVDCVGGFVDGPCSVTCGGGRKTSTFKIATPASPGGKDCKYKDGFTTTSTCGNTPCPVDCDGGFQDGTCSKTCGGGRMVLTYRIDTPAQNGGDACMFKDGDTMTVTCNQKACPRDCIGNFVEGSCSKTCGSGVKTRTYRVSSSAADQGKECPYKDGQTVTTTCDAGPCAQNCVGEFRTGTCSRTCGGGLAVQTYQITTPAGNKGKDCPYRTGDTITTSCNPKPCPVNCQGSFKDGTCSKTCGTGVKVMTYKVTTPASNGGRDCTTSDGATASVACNPTPCPAACVGTFVDGKCSKTCGTGGQLVQTYVISSPAVSGGTNCPFTNGTTRTVGCGSNNKPCGTTCAGYVCNGVNKKLKANAASISCVFSSCTPNECCDTTCVNYFGCKVAKPNPASIACAKAACTAAECCTTPK